MVTHAPRPPHFLPGGEQDVIERAEEQRALRVLAWGGALWLALVAGGAVLAVCALVA